jgi:glycosyltransferase involved in cell wall biosynthesis
LLEDERDSLIVPDDDPHRMAAAVARLLRDPALAERLSRAGRAKVECFDWSIVLPQWQSVLTTAELTGEREHVSAE